MLLFIKNIVTMMLTINLKMYCNGAHRFLSTVSIQITISKSNQSLTEINVYHLFKDFLWWV